MSGAVQDVITHAKFGEDRLRGVGVAMGQILAVSIDFLRRHHNTLALPQMLNVCRCVYRSSSAENLKHVTDTLAITAGDCHEQTGSSTYDELELQSQHTSYMDLHSCPVLYASIITDDDDGGRGGDIYNESNYQDVVDVGVTYSQLAAPDAASVDSDVVVGSNVYYNV